MNNIFVGDQITLADENEEYAAFVEKFKPKKTTDDCYTPEPVYNAVADWVANEYHVDRTRFVRPFWPGANYRRTEYPADCIVVDNPPFSLRSEIVSFYVQHGIKFFIFSPALSLLSDARLCCVCHIAVGAQIIYENGAVVPTSFETNLENCILRSAPDLYDAIQAVQPKKKTVPKYEYPFEVVTAAWCQRMSQRGVNYRLERGQFIGLLDAQKQHGKTIFGGGLLVGEKEAKEREAKERVIVWKLSEREKTIVKELSNADIKNNT